MNSLDSEGVVSVSLETRSLSLCRSGDESGDERVEFLSLTILSSSNDVPLTFSLSLSPPSFSGGEGGERTGGGACCLASEEEEDRRKACSL